MILNKSEILKNQNNPSLNTPDEIIGHNDDVHENESETYTQKEWLLENIPFISTPDTLLDKVYYYRWKNLLACLSKRKSDGKYEYCEASFGSGYHRYIDCAQGAHVRDARWARNTKYLNDYIDVTPINVDYWNYLLDSVYQKYLLDGDVENLKANYFKLVARFNYNYFKFDPDFGLYYMQNGTEGQEAGVNGFDKIERKMTYSASYTAVGSSLEALTDNEIRGAFWSAEGSGNDRDYVIIDAPIADFYATGLRLWYKTEAEELRVFYNDGGEWKPVENLAAAPWKYDKKMTEVTFTQVPTDKLKVEFKNPAGGYTALYELVVCYTFEPWGCGSFWEIIGGDESYRMNSNCFMAAAAYSMAKISSAIGRHWSDALYFNRRGDEIKTAIFEKLWDDDISFFVEITNVDKIKIKGKESNCYSAWSFNLAPDDARYAKAWDYIMREDTFLCPFGVTTLEKENPHYMQPFGHGCLWNGPVWPYTYSLILLGMANLLHDYKNHTVSKDDYFELIKRYCLCHFDSGSTDDFAVREDHHPEENRWIAPNRDYNHSSFIDNILNGLLGIRPTAKGLTVDPIVPDEWDFFCVEDVRWQGRDVTVLYDKTGDKYGKGKGLTVYINGVPTAHSDKLEKLTIAK
ncbi:MAG: hypothetical protein IJ426_04055 [Clostridia bacterium]|nr:hypothetical protein [Clostridia bacterium]